MFGGSSEIFGKKWRTPEFTRLAETTILYFGKLFHFSVCRRLFYSMQGTLGLSGYYWRRESKLLSQYFSLIEHCHRPKVVMS